MAPDSMSGTPSRAPGWNLLTEVFGDPVMSQVFSEEAAIAGWLDAERALALAEARLGVLEKGDAAAIAAAAVPASVDAASLWEQTRNVGYPILPLVRMVAAHLPTGPAGRVHYGATTQDIMDTGLVLQSVRALDRLEQVLAELGDRLAELVERHRSTVVAARTHAQQAVPTTFGAKLAVLLGECSRHRTRLRQLRPRLAVVSLYGAGGTSAALGANAREIRAAMAVELGLGTDDVPWHVARDRLVEFGMLCSMLAATSGRLAGEVIELSRTELHEVAEAAGHHRGASSTMPQKANPIASESVVGMAGVAEALASALFGAMRPLHERAAGEWQVEWVVIPELARLAAGALFQAVDVARGLRVFPDAMAHNLELDGLLPHVKSSGNAESLPHLKAPDDRSW